MKRVVPCTWDPCSCGMMGHPSGGGEKGKGLKNGEGEPAGWDGIGGFGGGLRVQIARNRWGRRTKESPCGREQADFGRSSEKDKPAGE